MNFLRRMLVLALLGFCTGTALSQSTKVNPDDLRNGPKVVQAFRTVVAKPSEYTVRVLADDKEVAFGVIVDADGFILTKWSEIKDRNSIRCKFKDGKVLDAKIVGVKDEEDAAYDLALLKVEAKGLPTVQWRSSKDITVGRWVASVGTGENPIAVGVVSVTARKLKQNDQPPKTGNVNAGYLGVGLEPGDGGAKINKVEKGTPAFKAGLKVNDIVYEAAGKKIIDHESLINTIGRFKPGEKVLLKVKRGEEEKEIEATLGTRPKDLGINPQETMGTRLSNRRGGFPIILQHDSGVRPEDCGGPLVDLDGKAIGINIARAGRTETYALPSEVIEPLLGELKSGKLAPKETPLAKVEPKKTTPKKGPDVLLRTIAGLSKDTPSKARPGAFQRVHEVTLTAGATYAIEMDSGEIDSYLILEDEKGKKLADDDDSGGYPNAKIIFRAPSDGVYRIIATSFNPNETGNYTLSVRRLSDAEKEKLKK